MAPNYLSEFATADRDPRERMADKIDAANLKAAELSARLAHEQLRPCHLLGAEVTRVTDYLGFYIQPAQWRAEYSGVCAYGYSPAEACANFDSVWEWGV